MSATRTLFLCLTRPSEMSCGILKNGSDFVRTAIVGSLSSNPKGFFHELVQSLYRMIELCRRVLEVRHIEIT